MMSMNKIACVYAALFALVLAGCETESPDEEPAASDATQESAEMTSRKYSGAPLEEDTSEEPASGPTDDGAARSATAEIAPTEGNRAAGVVRFREGEGRVLISGELSGLKPGPHGFHIHEKGDCSAPDGTSAGGHFNPDGDPHGAPEDADDAHHVGDLGNIEADDEGSASFEFADPEMTLARDARSVLDKAVIVHAGADDMQSQPSGNAGARVACGVIRADR